MYKMSFSLTFNASTSTMISGEDPWSQV